MEDNKKSKPASGFPLPPKKKKTSSGTKRWIKFIWL